MMRVDTGDLLQFLNAKGLTTELQAGSGQIYFNLQSGSQQWPVFIRIYEDSGLVQALGFFPAQLQPTAVADTARLLHLFNKELDVPGFGMDEDSKTVFFRCLLPTTGGQVDPELVWNMVSTMRSICEGFSQAVEAIASGITTLEELTKKAAEMKAKQQEGK